MDKKFLLLLNLVFIFIISARHYLAQPEFNSIKENSREIGKYEKFELTIDLKANYTNPFDPEDVSLKGIFKSPSGRVKVVDGFYYSDFTVSRGNSVTYTRGYDSWKIRFTPDEIGPWTYSLKCFDSAGRSDYSVNTFNCVPSANKGFIRKSLTNYFQFDSRENFFAIGENMCWYGRNKIYDYKKWIDELTVNGGNFIRIWMCSWATALEWKETGLGNYSKRQDRAYDLDWIINYAAEKGVYIVLCFNNHGAVSTYVNPEWKNNPYNIKNGGPCINTEDFFTDSTAIKFYLRKLKYINARWGYSPNIFCWEFFNEIEWTDFYQQNKDKVIAWQKLNAKYLDSIDVNHHLLSTSYASAEYDYNMWKQPEIDFTQTHFYSNSSDIELIQVNAVKKYIDILNKPTIVGEFGLSDRRQFIAQMDPKGINFHNSLWTSTVCGALGTSMLWWWDYYIHPFELYKYYKPLSEFISSIDFLKEDYRPYDKITFQCNKSSDLIISPDFSLFEKSPSSYFIVDSLGIKPSASEFGSILFGEEFWNIGRKNPPSFEVNFDETHDFTVFVGDTSYNSSISIKVDGVEKINHLARRDSSYSVKIQPGKHVIMVDNSGEGWLRISRIEINKFTPALRGFASLGKSGMIGWLHNRDYNWKYIKKHGPPLPVSGRVRLKDILPGEYKIEMIDCSSGKVKESFIKSTQSDELKIDINNLLWDCAFKLQRITEKSSVQFNPDFVIQYPNPQTFRLIPNSIELKINNPTRIQIIIENCFGQQVDIIKNGFYSLGVNKIKWDS